MKYILQCYQENYKLQMQLIRIIIWCMWASVCALYSILFVKFIYIVLSVNGFVLNMKTNKIHTILCK